MSKRRVVVTGLGAVTPVGNNVQAFWESVKTGKIGIGEITRFDTADFKVKLAAEVKNFNAKDYMDFKAAKRMELFSQYAVAASKEAMADAGIEMEKEDPFRIGVIVGSGIGSLPAMEAADQRLIQRGPSKVDQQYGRWKRIHCAWCKGKMHQRSDCLCVWNTLYRRCISCNPVWRCRSYDRRGNGRCDQPGWCGWIYESDRS